MTDDKRKPNRPRVSDAEIKGLMDWLQWSHVWDEFRAENTLRYIGDLEKENARLREALEFYADCRMGGDGAWLHESSRAVAREIVSEDLSETKFGLCGGKRARQALEGGKEGE